jgi:hypothetical protein
MGCGLQILYKFTTGDDQVIESNTTKSTGKKWLPAQTVNIFSIHNTNVVSDYNSKLRRLLLVHDIM